MYPLGKAKLPRGGAVSPIIGPGPAKLGQGMTGEPGHEALIIEYSERGVKWRMVDR